MIVLRPGTNDRALVVVVVLIPKIPIQSLLILIASRASGDWKLIGYEEIKVPGVPVGSATRIALSVVLVDSISRVQRHPRSGAGRLNR